MEQALAAIPAWGEQDYKTSEPFEWLYNYKENKFLMAQLREEIKTRAGASGVKNFITLWNAFLETKKQQGGVPICNVTEFDGQPVQLICGGYQCDDYGITTLDRYGFEIYVCTHPILPVQRLVNIDTGETKVEIAYKRGRSWRTLIVDKLTLASSQKIIELAKYGIAVDSENARELVKYLSAVESMNYDDMCETKSVGRLGWIKGYGFSPYVDNLRFDGDISFRNTYAAVSESGDFDAWLDCVKAVREGGLIARIMLAASFASALVEPCNALPFFVHIWGGTEAGKTLGLMLAASVWANPAMGEYIHTFNSTAVGQEMMAGFCNSLPLCIDELQVVKDRRSFDTIIYMLAEGIGKSRGAKAGGLQRMQTWRNCIITTGEMPISNSNSGGGAVNRILEIDCQDERLFSSPREVATLLQSNYGFAGKLFIDALQEPGAMDDVRDKHAEFSKQLAEGESTEKQIMSAALLLTADLLAEKIIFQDGVTLSVSDIEQFLTSKDDVDQNARAHEWLLDFVASNPVRFRGVSDNSGECWGMFDHEYVYIIKSVFDSKMKEGGFSPDSFLSWAKRQGKIECDHAGRNTKSKWLNGSSARCVWLKRTECDCKFSDIDGKEALPF